MSCENEEKRFFVILTSKVLINVLLISTFICIFFFTYGTFIEKTVITNQMDIIANNFIDTFRLFGNSPNTNLKNTIVNTLLIPDTINKISEEDHDALKNNPDIIKLVTYFILGFIGVVIVIIGGFLGTNFLTFCDLKEILIESSVILLFIALTEYIFLSFFGSKFISIDTNTIKLEIINNLSEYNESLKKQQQSNMNPSGKTANLPENNESANITNH